MSASHGDIHQHTHHQHHDHRHRHGFINLVPPTPSVVHNPDFRHRPQFHAPPEHHTHTHTHQHEHHHDESYSQWLLHVTSEELEFLAIFNQMVPHIFENPYHYESAIAPALGYGRARELAQAMVIPLSQSTFSYIAPDGNRHIGEIDKHHSHLIYVELPSPLGNDMVMKGFVEQPLPPNGDVP